MKNAKQQGKESVREVIEQTILHQDDTTAAGLQISIPGYSVKFFAGHATHTETISPRRPSTPLLKRDEEIQFPAPNN